MKRLLAIIVLSIGFLGLLADRSLWANPPQADYEIWALDQGLNRIIILKGNNLKGNREVLDLVPLV